MHFLTSRQKSATASRLSSSSYPIVLDLVPIPPPQSYKTLSRQYVVPCLNRGVHDIETPSVDNNEDLVHRAVDLRNVNPGHPQGAHRDLITPVAPLTRKLVFELEGV